MIFSSDTGKNAYRTIPMHNLKTYEDFYAYVSKLETGMVFNENSGSDPTELNTTRPNFQVFDVIVY